MASLERHVLVVCTANVCRSPVAELVLARHFAAAGHTVAVASAGVSGGRIHVHKDTVEAARLGGIDLTGHVSRRLTADMIATEGADLVICMTREHVAQAVGLDPSAWPRSFTLKGLVRRASAPAMLGFSGDWTEWLAAAGAGRKPRDLLGVDTTDDVPDPYGRPLNAHLLMTAVVNDLCARLVRLAPSPD